MCSGSKPKDSSCCEPASFNRSHEHRCGRLVPGREPACRRLARKLGCSRVAGGEKHRPHSGDSCPHHPCSTPRANVALRIPPPDRHSAARSVPQASSVAMVARASTGSCRPGSISRSSACSTSSNSCEPVQSSAAALVSASFMDFRRACCLGFCREPRIYRTLRNNVNIVIPCRRG